MNYFCARSNKSLPFTAGLAYNRSNFFGPFSSCNNFEKDKAIFSFLSHLRMRGRKVGHEALALFTIGSILLMLCCELF